MLYFSKLKIVSVIIFTLLLSYFALSNFFSFDDNFFKRNINLGLDLQGGSYLLLEIDNEPVVIQQVQNKLIDIKKYLKNKNVQFKNIQIVDNQNIQFQINENDASNIEEIFKNKDSEINPYFSKFKTHQFNLTINSNNVQLKLSDYGLVLIKSSSQEQAIEIVRRRVDEVGTNEPNILKRGNDRILVELPGLNNPDRIKSLLGKTANLTFKFVTNNSEESFGTEKLLFEDGTEAIVSKRIVLSGENLIDAKPRMDTQNNQTVVSFNLDRVGTKKFAKATSNNVGKKLAIILDNKIISAPTIQEPIVGGSGQITGDFTFQSATDMAEQLKPLLGAWSGKFLGLGLFAAGISSAITAPLAAAYAAKGILGWKDNTRSWKFRCVWGSILLLGILASIFGGSPIVVIQFAQVANGILLPIVAIFLVYLMNNSKLLGIYTNTVIQNILACIVLAVAIILGFRSLNAVFQFI